MNSNLIQTAEKIIESLKLSPSILIHSKATAAYAHLIGVELGLTEELCNFLHMGGLLHDIGKFNIPLSILNKPTRLTKDEFKIVKQHPVTGFNMLKENELLKGLEYSKQLLDMVLYHHERCDGKGYPFGLKGKNIPLVARIITLADSFDAMTSNRIYRESRGMEYALEEMKQNKGIQFDQDVTDALILNIERNGNRILFNRREPFTA